MFRSICRPVVIPQSEHCRLAGLIAGLWGNQDFEVPELGRQRLSFAVLAHDQCYGKLDTLEVGKASVEQWVACRRRGLQKHFGDRAVDILVAMHTKRLAKLNRAALCRSLEIEAESKVQRLLSDAELPRSRYEAIYTVFSLCDTLSYHFCLEALTAGSLDVYRNFTPPTKVKVFFQILRNGHISINPWPLCDDCLSGTLEAFSEEGYPLTAKAIKVPFMIAPNFKGFEKNLPAQVSSLTPAPAPAAP